MSAKSTSRHANRLADIILSDGSQVRLREGDGVAHDRVGRGWEMQAVGILAELADQSGEGVEERVVAADEIPNFPHLELDKIGNFAIAKIKEAVLAVTGP